MKKSTTLKTIYVNNEVKSIFDLKYTKDETFNNGHIRITKDAFMYISEEFANILIDGLDCTTLDRRSYYSTKYSIKYGSTVNYHLTIFVRCMKNSTGWRYMIAGSSGSHGFGGLEFTSKEELGVRTRRRVNKKIVELFLKSPYGRVAKIDYLKEKMYE